MTNQLESKKKILIVLLLSILVLASYWGVQGNGFTNYDDPVYVLENRHVREGLSWESLVWAFTASYASNWHPLTWLSLMLDRDLYWMNAGGYHWTSLMLHLLGVLVLFHAMHRMTGNLWCSGLVAGLFGVHPLHVESVAWVSERKDVLSGLFWMLGLWGYAWYVERPGLKRYWIVLLFFVLGLLSKPMVVTFPFVLLLLDWWPLGRLGAASGRGLASLLYEKIPLFVLSAVSSVVTFVVQRGGEAMPSLGNLPFGERLGNAAVSYGRYLLKMVFPYDLAVFYPYPGAWSIREVFLSLTLLVLITGFVVMRRHRQPYWVVGWLWYLGTLVPVIGLVQVGAQAMADRYAYLPMVGIYIMTAWGAKDLLNGFRGRRIIWSVVSTAVMITLIVLTQIQVRYWKDDATLFGNALRITDRNFMAHQILAEGMVKAGDLVGAENHYREAMRIKPSFKQAYNHLGYLLIIQGKHDEAGPLLEKALQIDPTYVPAMKNLADVRMRQRRIDEAIPLYREALLHGEDDWELLNNYGVALFYKGDVDEAVFKIRAALRLRPEYAEARKNLQKILETIKVNKN
jgi:protein O-mannosyl-transferase